MCLQVLQSLGGDGSDVLEMGKLIAAVGVFGFTEIIQRPLGLDLGGRDMNEIIDDVGERCCPIKHSVAAQV